MKHGDVEAAEFGGIGGIDNMVRVTYWYEHNGEVKRHTSYFIAGTSLAAQHLVKLLTADHDEQQPPGDIG